jgi:hypothetical protein
MRPSSQKVENLLLIIGLVLVTENFVTFTDHPYVKTTLLVGNRLHPDNVTSECHICCLIAMTMYLMSLIFGFQHAMSQHMIL